MASVRSSILRFLLRHLVDWNKPLDEVREMHKKVESKPKIPKDIKIKEVKINGSISEWFIPNNRNTEKTLIYIHGGGYCLGIVNANRNFVIMLANYFQVPILMLNYRLAPENPFPAAIDDAVQLYKYLVNEQNIAPQNIGYIADSSGCGLTLASFIRLKSENILLPKFQIFMSPVVDLTRQGESFLKMKDKDPMSIKREFYIDNLYLNGNNPQNPLISPVFGDLSNFPQTFIQASEFDVFLSDSVMLADKLENQNCKVQYKLWEKMWHNFQMSHSILPEGKRAIYEIKHYIQEQIS